MEQAMSSHALDPDLRQELVDVLRTLSDREQHAVWGTPKEAELYNFDAFDWTIHFLYDDCVVLPDPQEAVGWIILPNEIPALLHLEDALGPMIRDLRNVHSEVYRDDPRWESVVKAAASALTTVLANNEESKLER